MDCRDIRNILNEHSEGDGDPKQQALLEEHLRSCEQCMLYAVEINKTIKTLRGLDEIEPPAWLTAKVMKKIREEGSSRRRWIERLFFPLHIKIPIEALATLLITVAAIFIFKNMSPEIQPMEVQPQAPAIKSMPALPDKIMRKDAMQQPQHLQEETKQKEKAGPANRTFSTETREIAPIKEEKPVSRSGPAPAVAPTMPAPYSSFEPSSALSSAARRAETGKVSGMSARDEMAQKGLAAEPRYERLTEKKVSVLPTLTLAVKALDTAEKEIEIYLARNNGEMKTIEQSETRIIYTINLDPAKTDKFLALLDSVGRIKEDRQALSLQSGLFKLVIVKQ